MRKKIWTITAISLVVIGIIILGNIILPVEQVAINVAPEPLFNVGPFAVTNAFFTSIILSAIILIAAFFIGRNLKEQPGGLQNIVEFLIETLDGFVTTIAPKKWAATFFPILATIFIYLLFANWFSLFTPLLGSIGFIHPAEHDGIPVEKIIFISGSPDQLHLETNAAEAGETKPDTAEEQKVTIVPFFRAPSSDLNLTLSLALMTMVLVEVFGLWEHGFGYLGHFIRFKGFARQGFWLGLIDFFVGLIELVSEFFKIVSFSFRLFGNIFAGEVVLIVILSLVSFLLILLFFGLELFVGLMQAFVFFILSLVFFSIATQPHEEEH